MMTLEEVIKMLEARLDCMHRSSSGIDVDCNREKCDDCDLNYAQGTVGEQQEALKEAISALEKQMPTIEPEQWWIPCSERSPKKYGWYQVTLKDGRVNRLYYDYKNDRWIDNVRKHMFELYDIYSKSTHKRITEEKEDVYWDDWVIAWMPLPEPYRAERRTDE